MIKVKKVFNYILWAIAIIFFVLAGIFVIQNITSGEDAYFFGFKPYVIVSGSMEPTIKTNGFILVQQTDIKNIKEGDIISFKLGEHNVCHRVVEITDKGLRTKGDNSKAIDNHITTADNFRGKVIFSTNILADYLEFLNAHGIFVALILPILAIVLLIISIKLLSKKLKTPKTPKAPKAPKSPTSSLE